MVALKLTLAASALLGLSAAAPAATNTTSSTAATATSTSPALPTVDLNYTLQRASAYNATGNYYNFTNIRYAAAPIGNKRFRVPQGPAHDRSVVQDGGALPITCPAAGTAWMTQAVPWVTSYLAGQNISETQASSDALNASITAANVPAQAPGTSEDCLFLDVMVPKTVYDKRNNTGGAPVMVWIEGGGFTRGSKAGLGSGNPAGLISSSMVNKTSNGMIFVAINYRLGAFGWLAGDAVEANGTANAGLHDQVFALQWVQSKIHLFGGDPNRVTVAGESGGGASIMYHLTASGGKKTALFNQAIVQSAATVPRTNRASFNAQFNQFMGYANVTSLDGLRTAPSDVLIAANTLMIWKTPYASYLYGPSTDGTYVTDIPEKLLLAGKTAPNVAKIMVGHNTNEGLKYTNPLIQNTTQFNSLLSTLFPSATSTIINYISGTLYPAVYDGSQGYTDLIGRTSACLSDFQFNCHGYAMDKAYQGKGYAYWFNVLTSLHAADVAYTFNVGTGTSATMPNVTAAFILQDWVTSFVKNGVPTAPTQKGAVSPPIWGSTSKVAELTATSNFITTDSLNQTRCAWWVKGLWE